MKRFSVICIFIMFFSLFASGEESLLEKARRLAGENKIEEAVPLYRQWFEKWLEEHRDDEPVVDVVAEYIRIENEPAFFVSTLVPVIPHIQKASLRSGLTAVCALVMELGGNTEEAVRYYIKAANSANDDKKSDYLLNAAELIFEQGDFERTKELLTPVMAQKGKSDVRGRAACLYARSLFAAGNTEEAERYYRIIMVENKDSEAYPQILLGYCELCFVTGKKEKALEIYELLRRSYSGSPEYYCAGQLIERTESLIESFPGPSSYFLPYTSIEQEVKKTGSEDDHSENPPSFDENAPLFIQTGSYVMKDNALEMVKELESHSFKAVIIEKLIGETRYYRVVIEVKKGEISNDIVLRLKEAGYEGFLVSQ
ncbi:MAG: tetratricopeptide repeat protein [Spirochaetales bacterium]|nr:tetratricopeptide repeat protein [Spirochaetales bacterium]